MSRPRGVAGLAGRPPPFRKRSGQLRDVTKAHYEAFQRRLRFGEERSRRLTTFETDLEGVGWPSQGVGAVTVSVTVTTSVTVSVTTGVWPGNLGHGLHELDTGGGDDCGPGRRR
jgi:hypothetical protein